MEDLAGWLGKRWQRLKGNQERYLSTNSLPSTSPIHANPYNFILIQYLAGQVDSAFLCNQCLDERSGQMYQEGGHGPPWQTLLLLTRLYLWDWLLGMELTWSLNFLKQMASPAHCHCCPKWLQWQVGKVTYTVLYDISCPPSSYVTVSAKYFEKQRDFPPNPE